jgi:hypothetical protein
MRAIMNARRSLFPLSIEARVVLVSLVFLAVFAGIALIAAEAVP